MTWLYRLLARFDAWVDGLDVYAPRSKVSGHGKPLDTPPAA